MTTNTRPTQARLSLEQAVIEAIRDEFRHDPIWLKAAADDLLANTDPSTSPEGSLSLELGGKDTKSGNPHTFSVYAEDVDYWPYEGLGFDAPGHDSALAPDA